MKNRFFIMGCSQNDDYISPIIDEAEDVMLFETEEAAISCASDHPMCQAFGYEIFERGTGTW